MFKLKKLNAIIALEIIIAMILYYFLVVGYAAVSYAIDIVETNNHNVDFSAYFINPNGEKVDSVEKFINEEEYLYVDVTVKNEGFFNGTLNLSNNNFNIKQEILSENIEQINGNEIKLKQINAGATETIKLAIEPVKDNEILKSVFYGKTNVNLSGKYVNSKNIENGSFDEINGTTSVGLVWKATDEILSDLETTILTNKIYENSKRIVQLLVNSSIKNNEFPIGKSILNLNVPENVQEVKVFARQTTATNPKLKFGEASYKYDKTNHTLNIQIENNDENTIFWNKNSKDTFIITYIFDKDYDVSKDSIKVDSNIFTYDNKEIKNSTNININEEKDGVVTNELLLKENSIFKGNLYTGEEREFTTYSKTYINNLDYVEKIVVNEYEAKYLKNEELINANILYKSISINKQEFLNLFGENGYITIKDETGVTIGNISKNSTEDENGNIKLNFSIGKKSLKLETSKPILEGTLNIENIKSIQNTETSREFVNDLTGIKEELQTNYNDKIESVKTEKTIELKNTISKASLECTSEKITSGKNNEQIELIAKLNTLGEEYNLYKNPQIEIILPKEMENVSLNQSNILYKNGLTIQTSDVVKREDDRYAIIIKCDGEQDKYSQNEETELHIYIEPKIKDLEQDCVATLEMYCSNEYDETNNRFEKNINIEKNLEAKEKDNIVNEPKTEGEIDEQAKDEPKEVIYKVSAVRGTKELTENDIVYEQETIKYKLTIKNNTDEDLEKINVKAVQQNGKMWKNIKEQIYNPYYNLSNDENFYRLTDSNELEFDEISILKAGESLELTYDATADFLENETEKKLFSDITIISDNGIISKQITTIKNKIEKAKLDIKINQTQSDAIDLYEDMGFPTSIKIRNFNESDLNNIVLKILFSKNLLFNEETTMDFGDLSERISISSVNKNNKGETFITINITKLESKKELEMFAVPRIGDIIEPIESINVLAQATLNNNEKYYSNEFVKNAKDLEKNIKIDQKVYCEEKEVDENFEVPNESKIKIATTITNNNKEDAKILIENILPNGLQFEKATINIDNGKKQYEITNGDIENEEIKLNDKTITIEEILESKKTMLFNIEAILDTSEISEKQIKNEFNLTDLSSIISYYNSLSINTDREIIEEETRKEEEIEQEDEENFDDNAPIEEEEKKEEEKEVKEERVILGNAWLDSNKNGMRDEDEPSIQEIKVKVKNLNTGEIINSSTTTGKDGKYTLELPKGKYIIMFMIDTNLYKLTTYQANGVSDDLNSDAVLKEFEIDGKKQTVAATDEIDLQENLNNIDVGLIEKEKFDLKLKKYVSKIALSNKQGERYINFDNSELAKVEIKAKYLSGTTVAIEYKIEVTNEGEVAGYAKQIVDYKPQDLTFNSSINPGWYQNGNDIYTDSLANTLINPGETKEVTLILTKTMTETNVGLINNLAEISQDYNSDKLSDINSIVANKNKQENDLGQANVIISVSTGALINYLLITFTISGVVTLLAICIGKKIIK